MSKIGGILRPIFLRPMGNQIHPLTTAHIIRVAQQGGVINETALLNTYVLYLVNNGLMSSQYIGAIPSVTGYKIQSATTDNCQVVFSVDPAGSTSGAYIGDISQATLVNQPKLLKYAGEKYLWNSGILGNYCSAPKVISSTNIYEVIAKANLDNFTSASYQYLISTNSGGIDVAINNSNKKIYFDINNGAGGSAESTVALPYSAGQDFWVKVNRNITVVKIYTSLDGIIWNQLGTDLTVSSTNFITITDVGIGNYLPSMGTIYGLLGKLYNLSISFNNTAPTVNFDFTNFNPAVSETTWEGAVVVIRLPPQ